MEHERVAQDLLDILCCPACRGDLDYRPDDAELHCAPCGFTFPIVDGIPVLFPTDVKSRMDELFDRYWDSEDQANTYDTYVEGEQSMLDMHNHRGEMRATLAVLGDVTGRRLLDCGCGNGRFSEEFPEDLYSVGIDASLNLLRICKQKARYGRLVCCELEHLPFKDDSFDRLLSVRVLQHLRKQRDAVFEMSRVTETGAEIVLHLYNHWTTKTVAKTIRMSRRWQPIINKPFQWLHRSLSPFGPWMLEYDCYNSVPQLRRWFTESGAQTVQVRGAGFGFNKWLLDGFLVGAWLEQHHPSWLSAYLRFSLAAEEFFARIWPANIVMEKFVIKAIVKPRS
jgi:ubiquinone/menaquinone biosynthesis C-methylase UbiE